MSVIFTCYINKYRLYIFRIKKITYYISYKIKSSMLYRHMYRNISILCTVETIKYKALKISYRFKGHLVDKKTIACYNIVITLLVDYNS